MSDLGGTAARAQSREFQNRVAIITGASRGIGRALSLAFAASGAKIVANYHSNQAAAEALERDLHALDAAVTLSRGSVADEAYVQSLVAQTVETYGRVDILINNAGVLSRQFVMLTQLEAWRSALDINLTGAFLCAREVLRPMVEQRSGCILNMASVAAFGGLPGQATYASSKAGMLGLTRTLAKEVAKRGIRVNAIAPGYIATEMLSDADLDAARKLAPMGRVGEPSDVAELALFLASDRAKFITGQTIVTDGGLTL